MAEFHERELMKMASLVAATSTVPRNRGVPEPTARMVADGVVTWRVAVDRWCKREPLHGFPDCVRECLKELRVAIDG